MSHLIAEFYSDMQKFPLRMKDNDLLVTELYRDPANDQITSISVYLTPKTTSEYPIAFDVSFTFESSKPRFQSKINIKILSKSSPKKLNPINACQHQMDEKVKEKTNSCFVLFISLLVHSKSQVRLASQTFVRSSTVYFRPGQKD